MNDDNPMRVRALPDRFDLLILSKLFHVSPNRGEPLRAEGERFPDETSATPGGVSFAVGDCEVGPVFRWGVGSGIEQVLLDESNQFIFFNFSFTSQQ